MESLWFRSIALYGCYAPLVLTGVFGVYIVGNLAIISSKALWRRKLYNKFPSIRSLGPFPYFKAFTRDGGLEKLLDACRDPEHPTQFLPAVYAGVHITGAHIVLVQDPEFFKLAYSDDKRFPKFSGIFDSYISTFGKGSIFIWNDYHDWQRKRKAAVPAFNFEALKIAHEVLADLGQDFVSGICSELHGSQEPVRRTNADFSGLTLRAIIRACFRYGFDVNKMHRLYLESTSDLHGLLFLQQMIGSLGKWIPLPAFQTTQSKIKEMRQMVVEYARRPRQKQENEQSVDLFECLSRSKTLSQTDVIVECVQFLYVGADTTSNLMSYIFHYLGQPRFAHQLRKLEEEIDRVVGDRAPKNDDLHKMDYCRAVMKETLRMHPPIPYTLRQTTRDEKFGDQEIPKGTFLLLASRNVHRDSRYWGHDADEWKPERWIKEGEGSDKAMPSDFYHFLPFGAGVRSCVGAKFAMIETMMIVAMTIQKLRPYVSEKQAKDVFHAVEGLSTGPVNFAVTFTKRRDVTTKGAVRRTVSCNE